uniref:Uncharacterized protein n=1 Tax=Setaria italica TaxID=4555 RepID=K3YFK2_SETIT
MHTLVAVTVSLPMQGMREEDEFLPPSPVLKILGMEIFIYVE